MILLVCGGRNYTDEAHVFEVLDEIHESEEVRLVVTGAARGADHLAEAWARSREVPYFGAPAPWATKRKAAGPIRNSQMLDTRTIGLPFQIPIALVVAFPGGTGTGDMVSKASAAGIEVYQPDPKRLQPRRASGA